MDHTSTKQTSIIDAVKNKLYAAIEAALKKETDVNSVVKVLENKEVINTF